MLGPVTPHPRRPRPVSACLAVVPAVLLAACGSGPEESPPSGVDGLQVPTPSADPADYVDRIDNPWLPLEPGTRWVYRVQGEDPETITVTVTDETRLVQGVTTTVVHDVVTDEDGDVVEDTYDWFAQDTAGNVWYFGEETTEYDERGRPDRSGSWEAGVDGAQAGLVMPASPRVGDGYQQEYLEGEAEDRGEVLSVDESLNLPSGSWNPVLLTEDTTPLEPGLVEHKYYARGVGVVQEETVRGGKEHVSLVSMTTP